MEIPALNLVIVDPILHTNIVSAIGAATAAPGAAVWIPTSYTGTDAVPASPGCPVFDMRSSGNWAGGAKVATATAAAAVTAALGGAFATTLNLPGSSRYEGKPFRVRASGWTSLSGGTYTATVQPLVYASAIAGYTASVAAAIFSYAAASLTIAVAAAATLTYYPWEIEVLIQGDSTSGKITGRVNGSYNDKGTAKTYPTTAATATWNAIVNTATVGTLDLSKAVPIQFLAGLTIAGGTDTGTANASTLTSFAILDA